MQKPGFHRDEPGWGAVLGRGGSALRLACYVAATTLSGAVELVITAAGQHVLR